MTRSVRLYAPGAIVCFMMPIFARVARSIGGTAYLIALAILLWFVPFLRSASMLPPIIWTLSILSVFFVWYSHTRGHPWQVPGSVLLLEFGLVAVGAIARINPKKLTLSGRKILQDKNLALLAPVTLAVTWSLLSGCAKPESEAKLRISMIPTTDPGKVLRETQPLLAYWNKQTGLTPELAIPTSYAAVVEALANNKVDIAYLGGFTYVQAASRAGVKPLVQRIIDQQFHSVFITQANSKVHSLKDLHGRFVFGDVNSTSGHLMPLYYMLQAKVDPEVIKNAVYSGAHDATALAVANGRAEAGAMDQQIYQKMTANGQLKPGAVRIFYTTPPFFDYVWVANKNLDPKIVESFTASMTGLSASNPDQKALLDLLNSQRYVPASDADYAKLRDAARSAGLLH